MTFATQQLALWKAIEDGTLTDVKKSMYPLNEDEMNYALELAVKNGRVETADYLIKNGAVFTEDDGEYFLDMSVSQGFLDMVYFLVGMGVRIRDDEDYSVVKTALRAGNLDLAFMLLQSQ